MKTKHTPETTQGVTNPCKDGSPDLCIGHYGYEIVQPNKGIVDSSMPAYRLHYVIKGSVTIFYNGKKTTLKKNSVFILIPGTSISYQNNHKRVSTELYWVTFNGYRAGFYANEIGLTEDMPFMTLPNAKIEEFFYDNFKQREQSTSMTYITLQKNLFSILDLIYTEQHKSNAFSDIQSDDFGTQNNLQKMLHYINENLTSPHLSIKLFAEKFYMHPSTLSRIFKKHTSVCFTEYITIKRLEYAIPLLEKGDLKVNEIARLVGFEDPLYFSRVFKARFGCSPSKIAKKQSTPPL